MALDPKDLELLERTLYKHNDDLAVSIARSFERLEERIDASESRLYSRIAELEDRVESSRQDVSDQLGVVREDLRDFMRTHDHEPQAD